VIRCRGDGCVASAVAASVHCRKQFAGPNNSSSICAPGEIKLTDGRRCQLKAPAICSAFRSSMLVLCLCFLLMTLNSYQLQYWLIAENDLCNHGPLQSPCIDLLKCRTGKSIYVYDRSCSGKSSIELLKEDRITRHYDRMYNDDVAQWRKGCRDLGALAEYPDEACTKIFIAHENNTSIERCIIRSASWHSGVNHVMVSQVDRARHDSFFQVGPRVVHAEGHSLTSQYRPQYDISLPLAPKNVFTQFASTPAYGRKFLLTFKGTFYVSGRGWQRVHLLDLHDLDNQVAVVGECFELHGEHLKAQNVAFCKQLKQQSPAFSYMDLMNTTFALIPAGRSPSTYRLGEAMSAGAIPIFCADNYVRPFSEQIDWDTMSLIFPALVTPEQVMTAIQSISVESRERMRRKILTAYREVFGNATDAKQAKKALIDYTLNVVTQQVVHAAELESRTGVQSVAVIE
jgi:Exostosin family